MIYYATLSFPKVVLSVFFTYTNTDRPDISKPLRMTDKLDTLTDLLDDISEPSDWPQPEYQDLDRATRCSICKDFYEAPVITKCSHTFCSLCLQRYITINSSCPACRVTVALSETRRNHAVEDIVRQFKVARLCIVFGFSSCLQCFPFHSVSFG